MTHAQPICYYPLVRKRKEFVSQEYSAEKGGKNLREGTRKHRVATAFAASFFAVAVIIGISLITFSIMFFFSEVEGKSMMRTLNAAGIDIDSVLVKRHVTPKRGDVIVIKHYDADGKFQAYHIKRMIALPGDSFRFAEEGGEYILYVNGEKFPTTFKQGALDPVIGSMKIYAAYPTYNTLYNYQQYGTISVAESTGASLAAPIGGFRSHYQSKDGKWTSFIQDFRLPDNTTERRFVMPEGYFFYLGDNRGGDPAQSISDDGSHYGPQPMSVISGVVSEIIHDRSAPQWFGDKLKWFFTFRWIK